MNDDTHKQIEKVHKCRDKGDLEKCIRICNQFISNPYISYSEKVHMVIVMSHIHLCMKDFFGMEMDYQLLKQMAKMDPDAKIILRQEYEIDFNWLQNYDSVPSAM